ncbi:MAG: outer membrane protein assembly factor BamA [Deltaproteobacteria bacterium]|nr:outer membrane protein assembly factor BamA [Deltaproteobacteria bacterium]
MISATLFAQETSFAKIRGEISDIRIEGVDLIERGLIFSNINSKIGTQISPVLITEDIKALYEMGYFADIKAKLDVIAPEKVAIIFEFKEKPRLQSIEIIGNSLIDSETLNDKLVVKQNNMIDLSKINQDKRSILEEYHKKGYLKTRVGHQLKELNSSAIALVYEIKESPRLFLTDIEITGTKFFYPLDIERLMQSAEIDCFSWSNDSGVFQESKVNQDLAIITQTYMQKGFIRLKIDKPEVTLTHQTEISTAKVKLNITEGDQYFTGKVDIVSDDNNQLIFDKDKMIKDLNLQTKDVYNPFKQNKDQFLINDSYLEQGYAFAYVRASPQVDEQNKIVHVTYHIIRGEKIYIGRVEIQGNFETQDRVVRRELEIHDNELYNGLKLRQSQENINRLGFFDPSMGVQFRQNVESEEQYIDYNVQLKETQTGTFSASLNYSGQSGLGLVLSISKRNLFGSGNTIAFSTEQQQQGENRYDFSMTIPYWLDTDFTNSFGIYSTKQNDLYYNTQTTGFYFGLSYPVWKNWNLSSRYSWKIEKYLNADITGIEVLGGIEGNSYHSLRFGGSYSTVNHPMFPSKGFESTFSTEEFGGVLGGTIEFRNYTFQTRWFSALNEDETIVFMAKYSQGLLQQTNPDEDIPVHQRYTIGGITTLRGHDWSAIRGPSSQSELPIGFDITKLYPLKSEYPDCQLETPGPDCPANATDTKHPDRVYFNNHLGGTTKKILNLEILFPLTREGRNIRGVAFFDAGNVWAEDRMYELVGLKKDPWYFRKSTGLGIRLITPMGVLRFEYGLKLDKKDSESPSKFEFHISGLF